MVSWRRGGGLGCRARGRTGRCGSAAPPAHRTLATSQRLHLVRRQRSASPDAHPAAARLPPVHLPTWARAILLVAVLVVA
jgi:hypothetical protein